MPNLERLRYGVGALCGLMTAPGTSGSVAEAFLNLAIRKST